MTPLRKLSCTAAMRVYYELVIGWVVPRSQTMREQR
jgi:hypothetical protein